MKRASNPSRTSWLIVFLVQGLVVICLGAIGYAVLTGALNEWLVPVPESMKMANATPEPPTPTATLEPTSPWPTATATGIPEPTLTSTPALVSQLPQSVAAQMNQIDIQVSDLRKLTTTQRVPRYLQSREQLRQELAQEYELSYTEQSWSDERRWLATLGLIPRDFDLQGLYLNVLTDALAGHYDHNLQTMYVITTDQFGGPERSTYAHEYTHALQDLNYDFETRYNFSAAACQGQSDRCLALRAMIEGDATIVEEMWYMRFTTMVDQEDYQSLTMPEAQEAPVYFREEMIFPYVHGSKFILDLIPTDNYGLVNSVFENPPTSTEQILHPEKYSAMDEPIQITLPMVQGVIGDGWRVLREDTLGEWGLLQVLEMGHDINFRLPEKTAAQAAAGWGGDRYVLLGRDDLEREAMLSVMVWDSEKDAREFYNAMHTYADRRWGVGDGTGTYLTWPTSDGHLSRLIQDGSWIYWLIAPDESTLNSLEILGRMAQ